VLVQPERIIIVIHSSVMRPIGNFYSFYTASLGLLSEQLQQIFDRREYIQCVEGYSSILTQLGSFESLGMFDSLLYYYACTVTGQPPKMQLCFPAAPSRDEIIALKAYELALEEALSVKTTSIGFLRQPRAINKAILAAAIGLEHNCENIVETGTYLGISTYLFSNAFKRVETIEADSTLARVSAQWLGSLCPQNVFVHEGNSADILRTLINSLQVKTLFFLDGHYSGGITSKSYGYCPLIAELRSIIQSKVDWVIVIDDSRDMGNEGYPEIKSILEQLPTNCRATFHYDQIIITRQFKCI